MLVEHTEHIGIEPDYIASFLDTEYGHTRFVRFERIYFYPGSTVDGIMHDSIAEYREPVGVVDILRDILTEITVNSLKITRYICIEFVLQVEKLDPQDGIYFIVLDFYVLEGDAVYAVYEEKQLIAHQDVVDRGQVFHLYGIFLDFFRNIYGTFRRLVAFAIHVSYVGCEFARHRLYRISGFLYYLVDRIAVANESGIAIADIFIQAAYTGYIFSRVYVVDIRLEQVVEVQ